MEIKKAKKPDKSHRRKCEKRAGEGGGMDNVKKYRYIDKSK
ncbi:MAG: hypothetical protein OEY64_10305 [Nitrospinota bacterium]|nr:hypothetical protein [Nitrospinota bacterium]